MPQSRQHRRARPLRALTFVVALPLAAWSAMNTHGSAIDRARHASGVATAADADVVTPEPSRVDEVRHSQAQRATARRRWFATLAYVTLADQARVAEQRERMWDTLANCESGGNWNVVDRFGGGLGIYIGTWRMFDGAEFASNPGYATKAQQITVAERIYRRFGLTGWGCAHELGWVR